MRGLSDTDPKVARMQIELLRQAGPVKRLRLMASLSAMVVQLSRRHLEQKLGNSEAAKIEWIRINYGADLAEKFRLALKGRS